MTHLEENARPITDKARVEAEPIPERDRPETASGDGHEPAATQPAAPQPIKNSGSGFGSFES